MELLTHAQTVVPGAPLRFFGVPGNEATHTDAIVTAVTSIFIPYTGVATNASIILSGQRENVHVRTQQVKHSRHFFAMRLSCRAAKMTFLTRS